MERTTKFFLLNDTSKALKNQGFSEKQFQSGHSFSSQGRYNHFDTAANYVSMLPHIRGNVKRRRGRGEGPHRAAAAGRESGGICAAGRLHELNWNVGPMIFLNIQKILKISHNTT